MTHPTLPSPRSPTSAVSVSPFSIDVSRMRPCLQSRAFMFEGRYCYLQQPKTRKRFMDRNQLVHILVEKIDHHGAVIGEHIIGAGHIAEPIAVCHPAIAADPGHLAG
jgi:hypothetical protein